MLVNDAYVRASSKMAKSAAAFMEIKNISSQDDRLLDVESKVAKRVELHTHIKSDDGVMKMRRVEDGVLISGNDTLRLERGGNHIMFMGLSQPFVNGESILITLFFESAGPLDLEIPIKMLPEVKDCAANFGKTHTNLFKRRIPICGVAGDQQAATIGQACFKPGMMKSTYGTGCFALLNTGETPVTSKNKLLTTIAYQFDGKPTYALEGSIFIAGAVVQWLRDGLKIINEASETQELSEKADNEQNVIIVPAFVGLGAPYWNAECRGAVFGLTRNTGAPEMAKAALESVGFQTRDLLESMSADWQISGVSPTLRVDGGMCSSDWTMQFLSDIINAPVDRPEIIETTALGVAWLAGMHIGVYPNLDEFASKWTKEKEFKPSMDEESRNSKYLAWKRAVKSTLEV